MSSRRRNSILEQPVLPALERRRAERGGSSAATRVEYRHAVSALAEALGAGSRRGAAGTRSGAARPCRGGGIARGPVGGVRAGRRCALAGRRRACARADRCLCARLDRGRGPAWSTWPCSMRSRQPSPRSQRRSSRASHRPLRLRPRKVLRSKYFTTHELRDVEHARYYAGALIGRADGRCSSNPSEKAEHDGAARGPRRVKNKTGRCSTACKSGRDASSTCGRARRGPQSGQPRDGAPAKAPSEEDRRHGGGEVQA